jgi:DNA-binding NarL/FixJ family response regulator
VEVTEEEKDSLNMVINEVKPRLVLMDSGFHHAGTPYMAGQILKRFPKLNIAAISAYEFPDSIAAWFIFYGIKSYLNLWEGMEEFCKGLQIVRQGGEYISPQLQKHIDLLSEWPKTNIEATMRLMEVLVLLCNGFTAESIGKELHLSRKTVYNDLDRLCAAFCVRNRYELVAKAWELQLVTEKDMRFLDRRMEPAPLPDWAAAKQKLGRATAKVPQKQKNTTVYGEGGFNVY